MLAVMIALVAWQQPSGPVTRVAIEPGNARISIGDTLRLTARAFDAEGRAISGAVVQWFQPGGHFEGSVDSTGLVTAGATGTIVAAAVVRVAGSRPVRDRKSVV